MCCLLYTSLTLLSLMYDSGARVQEIIDLSAKNFISGNNPILIINGKGNKTRRVPIMKNTAMLLEAYISENKLNQTHKAEYPLFTNRMRWPRWWGRGRICASSRRGAGLQNGAPRRTLMLSLIHIYTAKKVQGAAENHYPTMSISELCALPVADLAAKDLSLIHI